MGRDDVAKEASAEAAVSIAVADVGIVEAAWV
jgi:hypothetical protein